MFVQDALDQVRFKELYKVNRKMQFIKLHFFILSKLGVFEDIMALPSVFLLSPNPSIIINATGFFIYVSP